MSARTSSIARSSPGPDSISTMRAARSRPSSGPPASPRAPLPSRSARAAGSRIMRFVAWGMNAAACAAATAASTTTSERM